MISVYLTPAVYNDYFNMDLIRVSLLHFEDQLVEEGQKATRKRCERAERDILRDEGVGVEGGGWLDRNSR